LKKEISDSWLPPNQYEAGPAIGSVINPDDWFLMLYEGEYVNGDLLEVLPHWNAGPFDAVRIFIEREEPKPGGMRFDEEFRMFRGNIELDANLKPLNVMNQERSLDGYITRKTNGG
jgi:hypothetical protein